MAAYLLSESAECPRCGRRTYGCAGALLACAGCREQWASVSQAEPPPDAARHSGHDPAVQPGALLDGIQDPVPTDVREMPTKTLSAALDSGLCAGADCDSWFPVGQHAEDRALARARCAGCPTITGCLELALRIPHGKYGIWGGTTPGERRQIREFRSGTDKSTTAVGTVG